MITNYNELYQYGILGMKWGIRRYQPYPKGHKGGKEVGAAAKRKMTKTEKRVEKIKQMRLKDERIRSYTKDQRDAEKESVLKTGSASEIYQYRGELTRQEMESVLYRLNWESRINQLSQAELQSNMQKFNQILKQVKGASADIKSMSNLSKTISDIIDAILKKGG